MLWRSIASEVEVESALQDVAQLDRIEESARRYEAEGKPHLAAALRSRATSMDANAPGGSICDAVNNLQLTVEGTRSLPGEVEQPALASASRTATSKPRRKQRRNTSTD